MFAMYADSNGATVRRVTPEQEEIKEQRQARIKEVKEAVIGGIET